MPREQTWSRRRGRPVPRPGIYRRSPWTSRARKHVLSSGVFSLPNKADQGEIEGELSLLCSRGGWRGAALHLSCDWRRDPCGRALAPISKNEREAGFATLPNERFLAVGRNQRCNKGKASSACPLFHPYLLQRPSD